MWRFCPRKHGESCFFLMARAGDVLSVPPRKKEFVYVLGYVRSSGVIEIPKDTSLSALQSISMAGGFSALARVSRRGYNGRSVLQKKQGLVV